MAPTGGLLSPPVSVEATPTSQDRARRIPWKALLGVGVTVFFLWWVFRGEDLGAVARAVMEGDPLLLLAAVAVATSGFLLRALRWEILLRPLGAETSLRSRFAAVNIHFAANNVLPARVGEFARAYAVSRLERVSMSGAFGSVVVERLLDAVTLLSFLALALLSPGFPENPTVGGRDLGAVLHGLLWVVAAALAVLVLLVLWPKRTVRGVERVSVLLPSGVRRRVVDAMEAFLEGLGALRSVSLLVRALVWSAAIWLWYAFSFWLAFRAYGIEAGFVAAVFVQVVVGIFVFLPSSPGFLGPFQAAVKVALTEVFGVASTPTLALAFGYHIAAWIPVTAIGGWYAWRLGFSLSEVRSSEDRVEAAVEETHPEARRIQEPEEPGAPEDTGDTERRDARGDQGDGDGHPVPGEPRGA